MPGTASQTFKQTLKNLTERVTGYQIERPAPRALVFFSSKKREESWFSLRAQLEALIERCRIDLIIDVGANEGQFGSAIRRFYRGEMHSFEPVSSAFETLAHAASMDPDWHVHKVALGSRDSIQTINVSEQTDFSSLLETNDYCADRFGSGALSVRKEPVQVRRLDGLINELVPDLRNRKIFLKMDTQGYDLEVFRGMGDKIRNVVALQSEVSLIPIYAGMPRWTECVATYEKAGFGIVGMFPVTRDSGRVIEYDCLLVRATSA